MNTIPPTCLTEAVYDISEWPIFLVTSPQSELSLPDYEAHMRRVTELAFARREPFVLLFDTRHAPRPDAAQRRAASEEMKRSGRQYPGLALGIGVVVRSAREAGVVRAITWLASPPYPTSAFDSVHAAKLWARQLLARAARSRVARAR